MKAQLIITAENGEKISVEQDIIAGDLKNFSQIENFVHNVKRTLLPQLEQNLLSQLPLTEEQSAKIKKKMVLKK